MKHPYVSSYQRMFHPPDQETVSVDLRARGRCCSHHSPRALHPLAKTQYSFAGAEISGSRQVRYRGGTVDRSRLKHWPSSHRISTREFVPAQIFGIGAGGIAMASGLDWFWALAIGCVVAGSMLLHVGGWSVMSWIVRYFRYLHRKDVDRSTIVSFHTPPSSPSGSEWTDLRSSLSSRSLPHATT